MLHHFPYFDLLSHIGFFTALESVNISAWRSLWLIIFFFPEAMQWFSANIAFMFFQCVSFILLPLFCKESHCPQAEKVNVAFSISTHRFQSLFRDPQMFLNQLLDIISRADARTAWGLLTGGIFEKGPYPDAFQHLSSMAFPDCLKAISKSKLSNPVENPHFC